MLQFYDKAITVSALALAALCSPSFATLADDPAGSETCRLADGYATDVAGFIAEAEACLAQDSGLDVIAVDQRIRALTERHRARYDLPALAVRDSLDAAARAHAMDMAQRDYAAHTDLSGLTHLDRVRRLDRTGLFGAIGANITVVPAGTDPIDAFNALVSDPVNKDNLTRDIFSHAGLGVAKAADGRLFIVQVFARLDGDLDAPAPTVMAGTVGVSARLYDGRLEQTGWRLESPDAVRLASAGTNRIGPRDLPAGTAMLEIDARLGTQVYVLRGPALSTS